MVIQLGVNAYASIAGMEQGAMQVQCQICLLISQVSEPEGTSWDCPCGSSFCFRRCASCRLMSYVPSLQRKHEPWPCTWCNAENMGFTNCNDPAVATMGEPAADMATHGLQLKGRQPHRDEAPT